MPIWIERFGLPVLVAVLVGAVIFNVLKMDWLQKTGLGMAILGLSLFLSQTVYLSNKAKADTDTSQQSEPKKPDIQQKSEGANSPNTNITGNNNKVTINLPPGSHPPQPGFHEKSETVSFSLGEHGITGTTSIESLRKNPFKPFVFNGKSLVTLSMKGDTLLVDFKAWNATGKPPIEVKNNEFTVRTLGCDKNSNRDALEVVNANGVVLFQLIRTSPTNIVVNGIFESPMGLLLAGPDGVLQGPKRSDLDHFRLKPIFKYPAWKYPGQYAE